MCRADAVDMAVMLQSRMDAGEDNPLGFGAGITLLDVDEQEAIHEAQQERGTPSRDDRSEDSLPPDDEADDDDAADEGIRLEAGHAQVSAGEPEPQRLDRDPAGSRVQHGATGRPGDA